MCRGQVLTLFTAVLQCAETWIFSFQTYSAVCGKLNLKSLVPKISLPQRERHPRGVKTTLFGATMETIVDLPHARSEMARGMGKRGASCSTDLFSRTFCIQLPARFDGFFFLWFPVPPPSVISSTLPPRPNRCLPGRPENPTLSVPALCMRDARVYGRTTSAIHGMSTPPPRMHTHPPFRLPDVTPVTPPTALPASPRNPLPPMLVLAGLKTLISDVPDAFGPLVAQRLTVRLLGGVDQDKTVRE